MLHVIIIKKKKPFDTTTAVFQSFREKEIAYAMWRV